MLRTRSPRVFLLATTLLACASVVAPAVADATFLTAPAPGGFVQAGAGPMTTGAALWPGADHFLFFAAGSGANVVEETFTGDTVGEVVSSYAGDGITNGAHAEAGLGVISLSATNDAPDAAYFPAGIAHGGWSETFVISNPAFTGQSGILQFTLDVHGTLFAAGLTGSSASTVTAYKDAAQLLANDFSDIGNSVPINGGQQYQYGNWAIATFGNPPTESMTVNDTVTFAVPFTFGTPFKLGVYANARASMRSSGGAGGSSSSQTTFDNGFTWGGISAVYVGTTPTNDYTIASGSGIDWTAAQGGNDPADLDGNGTVDAADLGLLLGGWGTSAGDIDGGGTTDATDLALLLGAWG
ncbi:MAG: hypothetical protein JNM94_09235 [Phycisphaerae bacterium]|nr:hypothetical protein [Phycisphaerae bacterium]